MAREIRVTKEGFERLKRSLDVERERLEEATRILRDLSGSSDDYDDTGLEEAKREKAAIEERVDSLEDQLARAVVMEGVSGDVVQLGSVVTLRDGGGEAFDVQVVAPVEAGVLEGDLPHISDESPLGRALIGRTIGDAVSVDARAGRRTYEVLAVR
jgi:transcription elongation factor GreA